MPEKIRNLQPAPTDDAILTTLILFIDNPEHASLEPALAAAFPAEAGARIYDALLTRLRNLTSLFAGEKYLYYSKYPNWNDAWDINVYRKRLQIGDSVSARFRQAVDDAREDGPEAIIWMHAGAASLEPEHFAAVTAAVSDREVVIGAAPSGQVLLLCLGRDTSDLELPEDLRADSFEAAAAAAGFNTRRIGLPGPPQSAADLARIGITHD